VFIGGSFVFPYYYPYSYYPYAPYGVSEFPAYVDPEQPSYPAPPSYWYFCQDAQAYYPYVTSCAGGWSTVIPAPPRS
jgi:hypothetical protein